MKKLKKILFFVLFAWTATLSTGNETPSTKYDITTLLNNSIARTFQNIDAELIGEIILSIENLNPTKFETNVTCEIGPFENKFYFSGINVTILDSQSVHFHRNFPSDEVNIFSERLIVRIDAYLGATNDTVHAGFSRFVDFEDCTITLTRSTLSESLVDVAFGYDNYKSRYTNSPWFHPDIKPDSRIDLERKFYQQLPSLFLNNFSQNKYFLHTLLPIFDIHPEKKINSTYTDFNNNKEQYYYFIPNITSLRRTLSNITLTGLSNFQTHVFHMSLGRPRSTLVIKNIRGKANLFYGSQNSTIFPLQFEIFCISIMLDPEKEFVNVLAYDYSVNETKSNKSLTEHQSKWIIEGIQLAIASSIMPSTRVFRPRKQSTSNNGQHPITKIITTISQQFRTNAVKKSNETRNTSVPSTTMKSNLQIESANFKILVDTNDADVMSILHPVWIKCDLYNTLTMSFKTKTNSYFKGKILLYNTTHVFDVIDISICSVHVYLTKRNNSNEKDDYELHTVPYRTQLLSKKHDFSESHLEIIEEKAEQMMISSIEKNIILNMKSLLSSALDYCTSPVEIFDDFLPFYADYELPYRVPDIDNTTNTEELFVSKIHNVVISGWDQILQLYVWFPSQGDDEHLPSVNLELGRVKIRLNVDDNLFNFKELEITEQKLFLRNGTHGGAKIAAQFYGFYHNFHVYATNESVSRRESSWFRIKVEYLIKKSFE